MSIRQKALNSVKRKFKSITNKINKMNGVSKKKNVRKYDNREIVKNNILKRLDIIRASTKKLAKKTFTR
jgi:DNA-binding helix-hairpin-helix protein with protein kinase domain